MQYLSGLSAMGHDVYYFEDCGEESWVYDWDAEEMTTELSYPADYIRDCLTHLGLGDNWIYRAGGRAEGMAIEAFREVCERADLMMIRAVPVVEWREEYSWPRRRCYIDADPGFNQIRLLKGDKPLEATVSRCERLFTIGQRLGASDCLAPTNNREWIKTVAPVALPHWRNPEDGSATFFTTIMQWRGFHDVEHEGVLYGQKDKEFPKFLDLPRRTKQPLRIALTGAPPEELSRHGWDVVPGWVSSRTAWSYRQFIQDSRAEFSVAKHGYVAMRVGWFSDRSVCYLASGRPVLVEDAGLRDWLPVGKGVLTFRDPEEALLGIETINDDYEGHRRAARHIAEEYFAVERVLPPMLEAAMS